MANTSARARWPVITVLGALMLIALALWYFLVVVKRVANDQPQTNPAPNTSQHPAANPNKSPKTEPNGDTQTSPTGTGPGSNNSLLGPQ